MKPLRDANGTLYHTWHARAMEAAADHRRALATVTNPAARRMHKARHREWIKIARLWR